MPLTADEFMTLADATLGTPNPEQAACISHTAAEPLFIVAGPGSGKTRVLVLRALFHVLVEGMRPEAVVVTTFTRKAATEIRSRLIDWGERLLEAARTAARERRDADALEFLGLVDVGRFVTGTLDSLCEEALDEARTPAEPVHIVLDEFAARTQLSRKGELYSARQAEPELDQFLAAFGMGGQPPDSNADAARTLKDIADRLSHDLISPTIFDDTSSKGRHSALAVIRKYLEYLKETNQLDFARLEAVVLARLVDGRALVPLTSARALLVDEYQDTNLLQEQIYFHLARRTGAHLTVVGDDDQSLYRFRGATIELFRDFAARAESALACGSVRPVHLFRNYRSGDHIVDYFNSFIANDPDFHPSARVQPLKPPVMRAGEVPPFPVLGMFRDDPSTLANDVAGLLWSVFRDPAGFVVPGTSLSVRGAPGVGDFGDAILLSKSVNEFGAAMFGNPPKPKFPRLLRAALGTRGVHVYNPRGLPLHDVPAVQQLLGLVLEGLDPSTKTSPDGEIAHGMPLTTEVRRVFDSWRAAAAQLVGKNAKGRGAVDLAKRLAGRRLLATPGSSPREWPLLDAIYEFVPHIEPLLDDPEHQVYLEAVSRAAAQMVAFSTYRGLIIRDARHLTRSIQAALRDMLSPLADGEVSLDEEVYATPPRSSFGMMTIHQAKGLEFPLVLVDMSSEFATNNAQQRFKRFPDAPSGTTLAEDAFSPFTQLGPLRTTRSALQRTFEDLIREFYVAFSRPQCVLVLLGHLKTINSNTKIKHVGQFWRTDGTWPWTEKHPKKLPPVLADVPFQLI